VSQHVLTVDVEEWFHGHDLGIDPARWSDLPSRVMTQVARLLELLERYRSRATFFVLGTVAKRHPRVVRAIAEGGHEVASHGYDHWRLVELGRKEVRQQLRASRQILQDLSGQPVWGFRAPSWSVGPDNLWVLDEVVASGYRYDSSLFPVRTPYFGWSGAPVAPATLLTPGGARLLEIPPSVARLGCLRVPFAGGFFLRVCPGWLVEWLARRKLAEGLLVSYIHPWELDSFHPRLPLGWSGRLLRYAGLGTTRWKLERLLALAPARPVREVLGPQLDPSREDLAP